jgi:hypothetical protein
MLHYNVIHHVKQSESSEAEEKLHHELLVSNKTRLNTPLFLSSLFFFFGGGKLLGIEQESHAR